MFYAAERNYTLPSELTAKKNGEYMSKWLCNNPMPIYQDIHGRRVIHMRERFPCFDVYDRMYENRYFHWYFIKHESGVTMVYTQDDSNAIKVVEGVTRDSIGRDGFDRKLYEELILSGFLDETHF